MWSSKPFILIHGVVFISDKMVNKMCLAFKMDVVGEELVLLRSCQESVTQYWRSL